MSKAEKRSVDPATQEMLRVTEARGIKTAWDRFDELQPQCGFGSLGVCCRHCTMGPCRVDPFEKDSKGVCGATADIMAARGLVRMIAAGAAAHSDHGRDVAHTLLSAARGETKDYQIRDEKKLMALARELKVETSDKKVEKIAEEVAEKCFAEFGQQHGELNFAHRAPEDQQSRWRKHRMMPRGIDREIVEIMHRTHMGVDNDHENIIDQGIRAALADGWGGSMIATDLSDVLFGTPKPLRARANLGVLDPAAVNVIVHGHEPTLSEAIVAAASDPAVLDAARKAGATGVNLGGICCTANEILMRHGIALVGNFLQQELAISTGVVDAMVVDVQCVFPALGEVCKCFHTKLISTSPKAKFPGAEHIEFEESKAYEISKRILLAAVEAYTKRDKSKIHVPDIREDLVAGFSTESIFEILGGHYRPSFRPLNDAVMTGRLRGAAGVVGCNNPKIRHDEGHIAMLRELIRNDVAVVTTGCNAMAAGKAGLLRPESGADQCGDGLAEICRAVGIPPVLHQGSCVDISRILTVLCQCVREGGIGKSIAELPVAGAAPEWMSEKAVSIGFYVIASGVYTVLGNPLPVLGAPGVTEYVTAGIARKVGGCFAFEDDPVKAAHLMIDNIDRKRAALGLPEPMYKQPYPYTQAKAAAAGA